MIEVLREGEDGEVLGRFGLGGRLFIPDEVRASSVCLRFVDPYGDTVFNQLQLTVLIDELKRVMDSSSDPENRDLLTGLVGFLDASREVHVYVRFVGD
jgi:hypothetical protein